MLPKQGWPAGLASRASPDGWMNGRQECSRVFKSCQMVLVGEQEKIQRGSTAPYIQERLAVCGLFFGL